MGDAASGQSAGAGQRHGRRSGAGSAVLTPPTGLPALPDLDAIVPVQRGPVREPEQREDSSPAPAQPPAPPAPRTIVDPCVCGHGMAAHEHYRPGSDCGACGRLTCGEYRRENARWRRFLRRFGLAE